MQSLINRIWEPRGRGASRIIPGPPAPDLGDLVGRVEMEEHAGGG